MAIIRGLTAVAFALALTGCTAQSVMKQSDALFTLADEADEAYQSGNCLRSIELYSELTDAVDDNPQSFLRLGNCYAKAGDLNQAATAYQAAIDADPAYVAGWANLVTVKQSELIRLLERLIRSLDPDDESAPAALAQAEALLRLLSTDTRP